MLDKEDLRQLSDLLDEKFEANNTLLRAEIAQSADKLREEMAQNNEALRHELRMEMAQNNEALRHELRMEMAQNNEALRHELRGEIAQSAEQLRTEMALGNAKLNARLARMESDISQLKEDVHAINLIIEDDLRPDIKLLSEVYVPQAERFSNAANEIHTIKADIQVLNLTVANHSERLNQLAST